MSSRKPIAGFFVVAIFAVLLLPIIFGEPPVSKDREGGDGFRNWVYDFQTLITGLAAVGAATWTISVMEQTDRRQSDRHRELVALSQRGDVRRLSRAIEPQLDELLAIDQTLQSLSLDVAPFEGEAGDPLYRMISSIAEQYWREARAAQELLARPQFIDGSELFDGRLTHALSQLTGNCHYLVNSLANHVRAMEWDDSNFSARYEEDFDEWSNEFRDRLIGFRLQLRSVISGLQGTKSRYDL